MNSDLVFADYCDFSKTFDNFPIPTFLSELHNFDIDDDYILFLESYLTNRYQLLMIIGHQSNPIKVIRAVPYGSFLEPIFFLLYIKDLTAIVPDSSTLLFADYLKLLFTSCILKDDLTRFSF